MEYKDKLKTKEWQDRRREILVRDNFTCQKCGHRSRSNHVHHLVYIVGVLPWNHTDEYLITLCSDCHKSEHKDETKIKDVIDKMRLSGLFNGEIAKIIDK